MDMVKCEICGAEFKNTQGLRGHKTFKHGESKPPALWQTSTTQQQVSNLSVRLEQVESILEQAVSKSHSVPAHSHNFRVGKYDLDYELKSELDKLVSSVAALSKKLEQYYKDGEGVAELLLQTRRDLASKDLVSLSQAEKQSSISTCHFTPKSTDHFSEMAMNLIKPTPKKKGLWYE